MAVKYLKQISNDNTIQKLAIVIGKLEIKAISKLVEKQGLDSILTSFLSSRNIDTYYKSKFKLKQLLNE